MPFLCGFTVIENLLESDPKARAIVQLWDDQSACRRTIDKVAGEAGAARIYERLRLPVPPMRWWVSPIAMILAHDTLVHGRRWVERHHGKAVMESSPEYQSWSPSDDRCVPGRSLGERTCTCDYYGSRLPMLDCLQHQFLCKSRLDRNERDQSSFVASAYPWSHRRGSDVRETLESALSGLLEPDGTVANLAMFQKGSSDFERSCFWAQSRCHDFMIIDLQEHFADGARRESCLHAYRELAMHCHVAILREGLCWLCIDPESMRFGEDVDPYDKRDMTYVAYRDGTQLYGVDGTAMNEQVFLSADSLGLDEIDGPNANPWRRSAVIRRYGVKRYLEAQCATLIDERREEQVDKKLWRVTLLNRTTVTFLERSYIDLMDMRVFDYHELPGTHLTVGQAEFQKDVEEIVSIHGGGPVVIFNQPR